MLKDFRVNRGLSIQALSRRTGITATRLERFEKAERSPYMDELFSLAGAFRVRPSYIARRIWDSAKKSEHRTVSVATP